MNVPLRFCGKTFGAPGDDVGPGPRPRDRNSTGARGAGARSWKLAPGVLFSSRGLAHACRRDFREIFAKAHPAKDDRRVEAERTLRLARWSSRHLTRRAASKIPEWEQILSAGAACMNLMVAANALGFASVWLTDGML